MTPMRYDQKYRGYTMPRLILENYLRPVPHRMKDLVAFAGHSYASLRVAKNTLVRTGRLSKDGVPDLSHPENIALMPLEPLGEITILPKSYTKQNEAHAKHARTVAAEAIGATHGDRETKRLTESEVKDILSVYIKQGAGGKDFIAAVNAYLAFTATKEPLGLPAPLSPAEVESRILRLLRASDRAAAIAAAEAFLACPEPPAEPSPETADEAALEPAVGPSDPPDEPDAELDSEPAIIEP